ncbi:MAG: sensor histidine kinase, partial [Lachnospiraceae bacterium]|nr:sensor histidine kinase [Lachnospiraceae bacterium]
KISGNGYCAVRINSQGFDRLLDGLVGSGKGFMIVNEFWEPVYETGTANDSTVGPFRANLLARDGFDQDFADNAYAEKLGETGLWGIYITPPVMIGSAVRSMYTVILLLTAVSIGLSFRLSSRLSNALSRPIGNLTRAMKKLRSGDLSTRMVVEGEDEFGQLAGGFNKMAERLEKHVEERIEKEKELNRTQIGMVTAQLNPHFLYNTLDTIKWLAKDSGVQTIADLSSKLAKILRRSISGPAFCTLDEELDLVRNYCDIQAVRFDNKFEIIIEADPVLAECVIPKLIIQPIVENSIIHGLADQDSGSIRIEARRVPAGRNPGQGEYLDEMVQYDSQHENDRLFGNDMYYGPQHENNGLYRNDRLYDNSGIYGNSRIYENREAGRPCGGIIVICVTDNGCGIDEETARLLRNRDREGLSGHIGLLNADTIIRLNYGNEYGLTAEKAAAGGTRVTITLPEMRQ